MNSLLRSQIIQPKLTVSHPDDEYEREADRLAEQVDCHQSEQNDIAVAYPKPGAQVPRATPFVQRVCDECEDELHRQPSFTSGKLPKPKPKPKSLATANTVDKALEVMDSDTTDRKDLLEKWFNDSGVSTDLHVRAGFLRLKQGITSSFNFECEHKGEWFYDHYCDKTNGYVIKYVGIRVHLCEDMFGRPAPQMAKTIVHECSHKFDFTDDEENCPANGCSKSLNRWDAIDNAYSYGWFAYYAYHL